MENGQHPRSIDESKDLHLVTQVLSNYLNSNDFEIKSYDFNPLGEALIGFLGEHWKIVVKYVYGGATSDVSFFFKTMPKNNKLQADHSKRHGFCEREVFFHRNVFSKFKKYEGLRQCVPACYYANGEDMVLEDLHTSRFKMAELCEPMDINHAVTVIKSLATFHASSIILEETTSVKLGKVYRLTDEFGEDFDGGSFKKHPWYYNSMDIALKLAATSKKYGKETEYFDIIKSNWDRWSIKAIEIFVEPSDEGRNVIVHADLWNNNMMFKYDENNRLVQCVFVDYQCCRISKPSADLASFMYLCLDKDFRNQMWEVLIHLYHKELAQLLKESGLNVNSILPLKDLMISFEEYRLWGLVQTQVLFQFLFMDEECKSGLAKDSDVFEKLVNGDRSEELFKSLENNQVYKKRMMDIVDEYIERYMI